MPILNKFKKMYEKKGAPVKEKPKEEEPEDKQKEETIVEHFGRPEGEKPVAKLSIQDEVLKFLKREFTVIEAPEKLKPTSNPISSPTCILRSEDNSISMWYRLPIRGETGTTHIPDFVVFRGNYRVTPREKNPDIIIECRQMPPEVSNRTDPNVVNEVIGRSLDTLPAQTILVIDRELSPYARNIAKEYGIGIVEITEKKNPQNTLFMLLNSSSQRTRERMLEAFEKGSYKLNNLYRLRKKSTGATRHQGRSGLKERILKTLQAKPNLTAVQLATALNVHEDFILNELHVLERQGRVHRAKESPRPGDIRYRQWAAIKSVREE